MKEEKYQKCLLVVKALDEYFKVQKNVAEIEYPSEITYKSNEYFIYMFYSCLLDYGMRSKLYHCNLTETYKVYPEIFKPSYVIKMEEEKLKEIIVKHIHPRYPNVAVKKWIELSKKLASYDSILDFLREIKSMDELEKIIKGVKGFGQKTGGLLIRIICDSDICGFNSNVLSIPIDRHDIEISYLVGIISYKNISSSEIKKLSDYYVKAGEELGVNPSDVDKYLWEVGNSFCNKKECSLCPLNSYCKKFDK